MQVSRSPKKYFLWVGLALILPVLIPAAHAHAAPLQVDQENSVFAIVTHKAGLAKSKAHNHFVTAANYSLTIEGEVGVTDSAVFEIDLATTDLVVDEPRLQKRWYPRLEALGILSEVFADVAQKDRDKIRDSALGRDQLDAEKFPRIQARVTAVVEKNTILGEMDLGYEVMLVLEVHGKTVQRPVAAHIEWQGDRLQVEAAGVFQFTEFDIEPFSAFFGAVRNTDEFHVYVNLTATAQVARD